MNSPFDILKKEPEGSFRWVEAVNDLEFANIRIKELIALSPSTLCSTNARITSFLPPHQVFDLTPEGNDHYAQAHLPPQVTQSRFVSAKEEVMTGSRIFSVVLLCVVAMSLLQSRRDPKAQHLTALDYGRPNKTQLTGAGVTGTDFDVAQGRITKIAKGFAIPLRPPVCITPHVRARHIPGAGPDLPGNKLESRWENPHTTSNPD